MIRLFRVFIPASILFLILFDAALVAGTLILSYYLTMPEDVGIYLSYEGGALNVAIASVTIVLLLYFQDMYSYMSLRVRSRLLLIQQVLLVLGGLFISQAILAYINREWILSRWVLLLASAMLLVALPLFRMFYGSAFLTGFGSERVLFLGSSPSAVLVARHLREHPEIGMSCAGFVVDQPLGDGNDDLKSLGPISELRKIVGEVKPDRIAVGLSERRARMPVTDLLDLRFSGIHIQDVSGMYEAAFGRVSTVDLRPSQLIFSTELGPRRSSMRMQLFYSVIVAAVSLVVLFPFLVLVAIAIKLSSRGPVLFRQQRVGLHGEPFTLYKFRSMVTNAEAATGAVWASRDDPRVTPLGRFLRRTRVDELPQLFNVIRGEMSIVGPRPERPEFVRQLCELIPLYPQRHNVRPGITGWAQINYKYGESIEDTVVKLEYDLYYIKNLSVSLDSYIIFHTAKVMLFSSLGQ